MTKHIRRALLKIAELKKSQQALTPKQVNKIWGPVRRRQQREVSAMNLLSHSRGDAPLYAALSRNFNQNLAAKVRAMYLKRGMAEATMPLREFTPHDVVMHDYMNTKSFGAMQRDSATHFIPSDAISYLFPQGQRLTHPNYRLRRFRG